jgi:hypothetical protein
LPPPRPEVKNGDWIKYDDESSRLLKEAPAYEYVPQGTAGAVWRGRYNTGNTIATSLAIGYSVLAATICLWYVSYTQVTRLLKKSGISIKRRRDGSVEEESLWWVDAAEDPALVKARDDGAGASGNTTHGYTMSY